MVIEGPAVGAQARPVGDAVAVVVACQLAPEPAIEGAGPALIVLALSQGRSWYLGPLLGWGLGLAIHGLAVWLRTGGGGLYERQLQVERERLQANHGR